MSDKTDLEARIAAITNRINSAKSQHTPQPPSSSFHPTTSYRGQSRWTPYYGDDLRKPYRNPLHRNRSLVLNGQGANGTGVLEKDGATANAPGIGAAESANQYIKKARGNIQLVTKERLDQLQGQSEGLSHKDTVSLASQKIAQTTKPHGTDGNASQRILEIAGLKFRVINDGSKLIRVPGKNQGAELEELGDIEYRVTDQAQEKTQTPNTATVAGVVFVRTKRGNLVRANAAHRSTRYSLGSPMKIKHLHQFDHRTKKHIQCQHFTKNGTCPFGPSCKFAHDPEKVAICKDFLHQGTCSRGHHCDLSHETTYHRVPACAHFLRGNCTNDACRYPHVFVSPAARVCRAFATLGYCSKGPECDRRHVVECPDYANSGFCRDRENKKCPLPHLDHASTLRRIAMREAKMAKGEDLSDLSSDADVEEDADSDGPDEEIMILSSLPDKTHGVIQQQDFVPFS